MKRILQLVALAILTGAAVHAAELPPLVGRWDIKVHEGETTYPSWLEVKLSGSRTLVGEYVAQFGSARPVSKIDFDKATGHFRFTVPPQWEGKTNDITVEGAVEHDMLQGQTTSHSGAPVKFEGHRAPLLKRDHPPKWGQPIQLFNGKDLTNFKPRHANSKQGWVVQDGLLRNANPGNDLLTTAQFTDFKLHTEFRYPNGANSGIYLRGRYEVQIEDDYGMEPESHLIGGVYGFLTPRLNIAKKPGEWQTLDVTLIGREVSITLNGETIIDRQNIPGITGGALDSDEEKPGPLMIQGDHGIVEFRQVVLTPSLDAP